MSFKNYFIIGISGTTNSGKSSVASHIAKALPNSKWMCQDSYFYGPDDPRVEKDEHGAQIWEKLSALDMDRMVQDVRSWISHQQHKTSVQCLIIEGFTIFNHSVLSGLCDKKFFIKIPKDICAERRSTRVYNPPDYPGYFENIVWPWYLINLEALKDQKDIEYIDGLKDMGTLEEEITAGLKAAIEGRNTALTNKS